MSAFHTDETRARVAEMLSIDTLRWSSADFIEYAARLGLSLQIKPQPESNGMAFVAVFYDARRPLNEKTPWSQSATADNAIRYAFKRACT